MRFFFQNFKNVMSFIFMIRYLVPKIFLCGILFLCKIDKILLLVWIMPQMYVFCPSNNVPSICYGNNHFNIYLIATMQ